MTSTLNETILKVKTALDNVFVKKTDIKNNLVSTDTDKPLSANQGKQLNDNKVDKVSGKGLSKNDFTDTYKGKLDNLDTNLENKANSTHTHGNLQNDGSVGTSNNTSKNVVTDGNGKITTEPKPNIPSKITDLDNNSDYGFAFLNDMGENGITVLNDYLIYEPNTDVIYYKDYEIATLDNIPADVADLTDNSDTQFTPKSHTHGNLSNNGKISTTSSATMLYFCGIGASANTLYKSNKLSSDVIIDATAYSNLGTSANTNQSDINAAIDSLIGQAITYINQ